MGKLKATAHEDAVIREMWPDYTSPVIAGRLGPAWSAERVRTRARRLKLTPKCRAPKRPPRPGAEPARPSPAPVLVLWPCRPPPPRPRLQSRDYGARAVEGVNIKALARHFLAWRAAQHA